MAKEHIKTRLVELSALLEQELPENLQGMAEICGEMAVYLHEVGEDALAAACRGHAVRIGEFDDPESYGNLQQEIREHIAAIEQALGLGAPVEPAAAEDADPNEPGILSDESILNEFLTRQIDTLGEIENELLDMENEPGPEQLDDLKRFFHTLKGESGLLGFDDVAELCHATEDMIQNEAVAECIDRLLAVKDWLLARFNQVRGDGPAPVAASEVMETLRRGADRAQEQAARAADPAAGVAADAAASPQPVEIADYTRKNLLEGDVDLIHDFIQEADEHLNASEGHLLTLEDDPGDTEALNAVFRAFHTIKGLAGFIELDHVKDMAHKAENLLDMVRKGEIALQGGTMDLVFASVDMMKRLIHGVAEALGNDGHLVREDELPMLMGRLLAVTEGGAPVAEPEAAAEPEPTAEPEPEPAAPEPDAETAPPAVGSSGFIPLGNMKKKKKAPTVAAKPAAKVDGPETVPAASAVPADPAPSAAAQAPGSGGSNAAKARRAPVKMKEAVRVDADRLDRLIETIGELVIAESMVSQSPELQGNLSVKLAKEIDHLDKICRELQEIGMSLRMVPVKPVFQKMARLVRDLSKKQQRKVEFVMTGEDTELDKNVVDKIGDPLVHMVRNAVDHGIESDPAARVAAGKPEHGRVELRAYHKGGNICIEIEDDGRGLDKDAILAKAVSRGLVREGEKLSDREIFNLIFEPGFSTAKKVTEISGRGVGMDVVRRGIEELRGTVEINSTPGKGSVFSIKLPLTLAIIEGMVVTVSDEHYIIPTLSVVRLVRPRPEDISYVYDRGEMLSFEGSLLPLFRLHSLFGVEEAKTEPSEAVIVVVEDENRRVALLADDLIGQQSIVIKGLGEMVQQAEGVAGGAIMSDGNVALIVDVAGLVRLAAGMDTTVSHSAGMAGVENEADGAENRTHETDQREVQRIVASLEEATTPQTARL